MAEAGGALCHSPGAGPPHSPPQITRVFGGCSRLSGSPVVSDQITAGKLASHFLTHCTSESPPSRGSSQGRMSSRDAITPQRSEAKSSHGRRNWAPPASACIALLRPPARRPPVHSSSITTWVIDKHLVEPIKIASRELSDRDCPRPGRCNMLQKSLAFVVTTARVTHLVTALNPLPLL